jgi:hypothetical protein
MGAVPASSVEGHFYEIEIFVQWHPSALRLSAACGLRSSSFTGFGRAD